MGFGKLRFRRSFGNIGGRQFRGARPTVASYTGLLDTYSGAAEAYSLRALSSDWVSSDVVLVRRSSDNAELGFTAAEVSDGTLTTWTGANDGFVVTWYDQSGSGSVRNLTQATTTLQPYIVIAGTLVTDNGLPALDTRTRRSMNTAAFTGAQFDTSFVVGKSFGDTGSAQFLHDGNTANNMSLAFFDTGSFRFWSGQGLSTPASYSLSTQYLVYAQANNAGNESLAINGATATTGAGGSNTRNGLYIGNVASGGTNSWNGYVQELVIYETDESANKAGIETNINDYYSIY